MTRVSLEPGTFSVITRTFRNLALVGAVLLLYSETMQEARSIFAGVPSMGDEPKGKVSFLAEVQVQEYNYFSNTFNFPVDFSLYLCSWLWFTSTSTPET